MKKSVVIFVFFLLSLFTALVLGRKEEESMGSDKQNMVGSSYQETTQISQE
ncbi:MAG: hypothetical protein ACJAWH_000500 [Maribacter sp.]|jgi:hypothetical protein